MCTAAAGGHCERGSVRRRGLAEGSRRHAAQDEGDRRGACLGRALRWVVHHWVQRFQCGLYGCFDGICAGAGSRGRFVGCWRRLRVRCGYEPRLLRRSACCARMPYTMLQLDSQRYHAQSAHTYTTPISQGPGRISVFRGFRCRPADAPRRLPCIDGLPAILRDRGYVRVRGRRYHIIGITRRYFCARERKFGTSLGQILLGHAACLFRQ